MSILFQEDAIYIILLTCFVSLIKDNIWSFSKKQSTNFKMWYPNSASIWYLYLWAWTYVSTLNFYSYSFILAFVNSSIKPGRTPNIRQTVCTAPCSHWDEWLCGICLITIHLRDFIGMKWFPILCQRLCDLQSAKIWEHFYLCEHLEISVLVVPKQWLMRLLLLSTLLLPMLFRYSTFSALLLHFVWRLLNVEELLF